MTDSKILLPFHTDTVVFCLRRLDTRGVENCPIFFSMYNLHSEEYELNQGASKKVDCLGKKQSIVYTMNLKLVSRPKRHQMPSLS